ncbi:uncharacterized protein HMPREF1541_08291 [Cyphellophora europaea CBS 101466]|uniref:Major facilitator superfamily (MFS) profile domain-containing protein n=1 Tax=Cyphellophora europaea (strain CBS 101466) TaxID=1220924 RepID=W2RLW2_CYPE1|nr:uncharacterized protein HMPREF1541_08291 [Cyphellophora europaea CBS 101466]ETN37300.1 hypothetical protein HMPREF1541_08291 [Cyphellophora europaea CBS 101466]
MADCKEDELHVEQRAASSQSDIRTDAESQAPFNRSTDVEVEVFPEDRNVGYLEYRQGQDIDTSSKEALRVRRKIDLVILPIFFVTQCLQFMDRTALNYANLFGYQQALSLHGTQFNYLSAIVYAGYFFGQYPCGWLIGRYPAQKVLSITCLFWGLMVLLLTQCHNYGSAMAVRFLMGAFEAAVTPGLTLMTGFWYTRAEIPLRQCIWYSSLGFGGIIGSYISMGISTLPESSSPARWQLIFYILGAVTIAWSAVLWFCLSDTPTSARFLSHPERLIAVARVASNTTGLKSQSFDRHQALLSLYDWKTILIFLSTFAAAIPNGVLQSFSTVIIRDLGFSTTKTTQLKSVGDAIQIVALLIAGIITLNVPNTRLLTATAANIICTTSAALMAFLPRQHPWPRLIAFWLTNTQSVSFTIALTLITSNMAGYSHRASASALVFTAYCWGNFAGPFVVRQDEAPEYRSAAWGLLGGYAVKTVCQGLLLAGLWWGNRTRDRRWGVVVVGGEEERVAREMGMRGRTEWEIKGFRYVL